jgi:hypothetical protein
MLENIIRDKENQISVQGYLQFTRDELDKLSEDQARALENHFHGRALMILPESEVEFFEWLKEMDLAVWNDLWQITEDVYRVSIDFLHHFLRNKNGFPICDLIEQENFWFSEKHLKSRSNEVFKRMEEKIQNKAKFTFEEALLYEIAQGAIDIWHFCYRYKYPISIAKQKVQVMHRDDLLVHLGKREDLVGYLDI